MGRPPARALQLPILLGVVSALVTLYAWSNVSPPPFWGDEQALLLQAEIFADGSWSAPSPPLPEFFEQTHVLVEPVLASKYTPGHSLLLALGAFLGWVTLVPLLLTGITGGLVYAVATRLADGRTGLLTWWLWTASPESLRWRMSYLSQVTTACLLLLAWWLLLRWRARPSTTRLGCLAAVVGFGAVTRPYTMFLLAVPILFVVLRDIIARRGWRELLVPGLVGLAFLMVLPAWSQGTLGSIRETPREVYTRTYIPWDRMGFGLRDAVPERQANPELVVLAEEFKDLHRAHVPDRLPRLAAERLGAIAYTEWLGWRLALPLVAIVGAVALRRLALFAFVSFVSLFGGHLLYTHGTAWSVYYMETLPAASFFAAVGLLWVLQRLRPPSGRTEGSASGSLDPAVYVGVFLALVAGGLLHVQRMRELKTEVLRPVQRVATCFGSLPAGSGVFVRYAPDHSYHQSFVGNVASIADARVVTAHDLGDENHRLIAAIPDRSWFLYDEERQMISPLSADGADSGLASIACGD